MPDDTLSKAIKEKRILKNLKSDSDKPMTEDFWRNVLLKESMPGSNTPIPDYDIPADYSTPGPGTLDAIPNQYNIDPYYGPDIQGTQDAPVKMPVFYKHPNNPWAHI